MSSQALRMSARERWFLIDRPDEHTQTEICTLMQFSIATV